MQTENQLPKATHQKLELLMLKHEFTLSQEEMVRSLSEKSQLSAMLLAAEIIQQKKEGVHLT
jgi:hypothetical protein